ncbi:hypothetical protein H0H87_010736 [Tephrocybe sp. NHM501043]|nr:hypothetical protein H0H87_010736 [Tephrocybe sp. NHM501043]
MRKTVFLQAQENLRKDTPFGREWESFRALIEEKVETYGEQMTRVCNAQECGAEDHTFRFQRCSGCEDVVYCSLACQKADWTDAGHRLYCKKKAKGHEDGTYPDVSAEDRKFTRVLLCEDLCKHGLMKGPDLDLDACPFQAFKDFKHIEILIDYTVFPARTTISNKSDARPGYLTCCTKFPYGDHYRLIEISRVLSEWPLDSPAELGCYFK